MNIYNKKQGFSIIEIMVIIFILSILSAMGLIAFGEVRKNARDGVRVSDLDQIKLALTASFADDGRFPDEEGIICTDAACGTISNSATEANQWVERITGRIVDPSHDISNNFYYYYSSNLSCDGDTAVAVWARTMESDTGPNTQAVSGSACGGSMSHPELTNDSFIQIIRVN